MRILITGGAWFLGSHLYDLLIGKGHQIVCMDNLITKRAESWSRGVARHSPMPFLGQVPRNREGIFLPASL